MLVVLFPQLRYHYLDRSIGNDVAELLRLFMTSCHVILAVAISNAAAGKN